MSRIAMGMLCYSRPVHAALTIAFALHNKSDDTDFYAFYGIHKSSDAPNATMDSMLRALGSEGNGFSFFYMGEERPKNVQGNVDTLMSTLNSMPGYACYCKIDDDVIIGRKSDITMANILLALEPEQCYMLMGQAVPEHMRRHNPFCWEAQVNNSRVVQRSQKACPMETYTFVSRKCLQFLREHAMDVSCENSRGTYGPYTRKISNAGGKVCLVLNPAVNMQHIGLTTTIEAGNPARSWAPARSWDPMDQVIPVEGFDFAKWEASHHDNTQKQFALDTIKALVPSMPGRYVPHAKIILEHLEKFDPASVKDMNPAFLAQRAAMLNVQPVQIVQHRNPPGVVLRKLPDGRVVRSPGPVHRVVIRQVP
jgi:hypothetical protein